MCSSSSGKVTRIFAAVPLTLETNRSTSGRGLVVDSVDLCPPRVERRAELLELDHVPAEIGLHGADDIARYRVDAAAVKADLAEVRAVVSELEGATGPEAGVNEPITGGAVRVKRPS